MLVRITCFVVLLFVAISASAESASHSYSSLEGQERSITCHSHPAVSITANGQKLLKANIW